MAARGQLLRQRDGGEGMTRVAEGGEEEPAGRRAQTSSATARIMLLRASASHAIGVIISVPTPASR